MGIHQKVKKVKPKLVIGSPLCTMLSRLQGLPPWSKNKPEKWLEAVAHIRFMIAVYRSQLREGIWPLHHPAGAPSWGLESEESVRGRRTIQHNCRSVYVWMNDLGSKG